jgi:putative ABC transport system substrate-binding protein
MKNNLFKKTLSATLALTLSLSLAACGASSSTGSASSGASDSSASSASAESGSLPIIGIVQYGEHGSLDNCREGFLQGLEQAGLVEGVDYELDYQNAQFDDTIDTQIAQAFSAENAALMVGIATPSAMACYNAAEDKDIPVIFTAVTDPVQANLDSGNVTGTSDKLPVDAQLDLIRQLQPDATTIGIIYTTSEPNSVSAIAEYEASAPAYGFTIDSIGVTSQAEVTQAVDKLIADGVDCFSNLTDNNVVGVLASILEKTNEAGIPVYGSEVEQVKLGCVAAAGLDYVQLGIQTGIMAAKIFRGEATCQDTPYETISEYGCYINTPAMTSLNITMPEITVLAGNAVSVIESGEG